MGTDLERPDDKRRGDPKARLTVAEAVADLGMGPAQVFVVMLSSAAVSFCDGAELNLMNLVALATSRDFHLGANERASLSMVTLAGVMLGSLCSGYWGDSLGRRRPTVWCLASTALFGFVGAILPNYLLLLTVRTMLGLAMGFGLPPSLALASEITPEAWRIPVKAISSVAFTIGGLFVALLAAFDDPTYQALDWRRLMFIAAVPPAMWWAVASWFLHESPVFLASVGRSEEAREAFARLRRMNERPETDVDLGQLLTAAAPKELPPAWSALSVVFSKKYICTTTALFLTAFTTNLVSYGDAYAAPQVLADTSDVAPAWMLVTKSGVSFIATLAAGFVGQVFPRKWTLVASQLVLGLVTLSFAIAGQTLGPRSPLQAVLYQLGANGSVVGCALGFMMVFQLSVEIYPTTAATTGGAVIIGGGRISAVMAPMVFENMKETFGTWTSFYFLLAAACSVSAIADACITNLRPYQPGSPGMAKVPDTLGGGYGTLAQPKER